MAAPRALSPSSFCLLSENTSFAVSSLDSQFTNSASSSSDEPSSFFCPGCRASDFTVVVATGGMTAAAIATLAETNVGSDPSPASTFRRVEPFSSFEWLTDSRGLLIVDCLGDDSLEAGPFEVLNRGTLGAEGIEKAGRENVDQDDREFLGEDAVEVEADDVGLE